MRSIPAAVLLLCALPALGDLYRWVDPESGSVKYSTYPPAWYSEGERDSRAPRVDVIPSAGKPAAIAPAPAPQAAPKPAPKPSAEGLAALEERFKGLLKQISGLPTEQDYARSGAGFKQQLETYNALSAELDRIDPKGAERRRAEAKPLLEKLFGK